MCFFSNPDLSGLSVGSKDWFFAQKKMIKSKPLIKRCYDLWYKALAQDVASVPGDGIVLELGSGAGHIKEFIPYVVTSDLTPGVADVVVDGCDLPFPDNSVKAILLTHVFHHLSDVRSFLKEADRVLVSGGVVSMIECAHTPLGRVFFDKVHPEPYRPDASTWEFEAADSMFDSNQALSWIVFERDCHIFRREFPNFSFSGFTYFPWLSYLLSGGVNLKSIVPRFAAPLFSWLDDVLRPLDRLGAIHWHLMLRKK